MFTHALKTNYCHLDCTVEKIAIFRIVCQLFTHKVSGGTLSTPLPLSLSVWTEISMHFFQVAWDHSKHVLQHHGQQPIPLLKNEPWPKLDLNHLIFNTLERSWEEFRTLDRPIFTQTVQEYRQVMIPANDIPWIHHCKDLWHTAALVLHIVCHYMNYRNKAFFFFFFSVAKDLIYLYIYLMYFLKSLSYTPEYFVLLSKLMTNHFFTILVKLLYTLRSPGEV